MRLKLPSDQRAKLEGALRRARTNEIGGQIFGEQVDVSIFRGSDLIVQSRQGGFARFVVDVLQAAREALRFFDRTRHEYTRYNYIGEWHSHPNFALRPSGIDLATIREMVQDPQFAGSFAVLMIVRLDRDELSAAAWFFDPAGNEGDVLLEYEQ